MLDRRRLYISFSFIALVAVLLVVLLWPLGLQAVLVGDAKDVLATPSQVSLYASRLKPFCYPGVLQIRNEGLSGLTYELNFSISGLPAYFEARAGNETVVAAGGGVSVRSIRLGPGEAVSFTLCVMAPSPGQIDLRVWDPRYEKATEQLVRIRVVETDWWDNSFPRRISITPLVRREGVVLFEIWGSGDVYANGRFLARVPPLQGTPADSLAVAYLRGNTTYLLPFQVEAWERGTDGVVTPKGLRSGTIGGNDRLVFAAYVSNNTRIDIYTGGKPSASFKPGVNVSGGSLEAKGFKVSLDEWGFSAPGIYVNLSGRIAYTYQVSKTYYSDPGEWRVVAVGPVRAVAAFNTSGFSEYSVEAFLAVWGLGLNASSVEVWPAVWHRGIVLEWDVPLIKGNASIQFICTTTCNSLPARLAAWGVRLCENYWTPGARYGYFTLFFNWTSLGEIVGLKSRLSNFPGGG